MTDPAVTARGFLRALGIAGWDALEPAVLAAFATESPLLLARLAEALGLAFRHYNASILSFDDLLGYPVPQDRRWSDRLRMHSRSRASSRPPRSVTRCGGATSPSPR